MPESTWDGLYHELRSDSETLCGLNDSNTPENVSIELGCNCGHCVPVTCPVCKAILSEKVS